MHFRHIWGGALLIVLGGLLGGACIGVEDTPGGQCELFGGTCVAALSQCAGSLPYQCNSGVCCESMLPAPPDGSATLPATDATLGTPDTSFVAVVDSTVAHDGTITVDSTVGTPDVTTSNDVSVPVDTGSGDVATADVAAPVDTGVDAGVDAHVADAHVADAHAEDAHEDAKAADASEKDGASKDAAPKDAAGRNFEAGFTCNMYASPNEPATACNVATCPADPFCQPNSCFNGDYCHLSTGKCVMPSGVKCDGGI